MYVKAAYLMKGNMSMKFRQATKRRRAAAGVVAGLLLTATTALTATQPVAAADAEIASGTIEWGVKQSFRNYLAMPFVHGSITTDGGASQNAGNGTFEFPVTGGDHDGAATSVTSAGSVHFVGHDEILDIEISDVRVEIDGTAGVIVVDAVSRPFTDTETQNDPVAYDDVALADLDLTGITPTVDDGVVTFANVPATLTADGRPAFGNFYLVGEAFDPVTISFKLAPELAFSWAISGQSWTLGSLNQCRQAIEPAALVPGDWIAADGWDTPPGGLGWEFPAATSTHNVTTGETTLTLDGELILGNRNQGNYRLWLSDLTIGIDDTGAGAITADIKYSLNTDAGETQTNGTCESNLTRPYPNTADDVTLITFTADPDDRVIDANNTLTWTIPSDAFAWWGDDPTTQYSFDPDFIAALPASLQGHFRATDTPTPAPNSATSPRQQPPPPPPPPPPPTKLFFFVFFFIIEKK